VTSVVPTIVSEFEYDRDNDNKNLKSEPNSLHYSQAITFDSETAAKIKESQRRKIFEAKLDGKGLNTNMTNSDL
jgi:hypothetical protein